MRLSWYRWEPGSVPYLDRVSDETRGILWRWMDDYWRGLDVPGMGASTKEAEMVWPVLRDGLDAMREHLEQNHKVKHFNAVNANRIRWGSKRIPSGSQQDPTRIQEEEEEVEEEKTKKEKTTMPIRARRTPKKKEPQKEETLESLLQGREGIMWERYWKLVGLWPSDKNPAPKRTARAFLRAMEQMAGNEKAVFWAAIAYRDKHVPPARREDESRFMKNVETWLSEEGWQAEQAIMVESLKEPS